MRKHRVYFVVSFAIVLLLMGNLPFLYRHIAPSNPVIKQSNYHGFMEDEDDYGLRITGVVKNIGGDGYIVVESRVSQNGKEYIQKEQVYIESFDSAEFELEFHDVNLLQQSPNCEVLAYSVKGSKMEF